ncbi:hypothetical protein C0J52_09345, partial [Blattella germanica]
GLFFATIFIIITRIWGVTVDPVNQDWKSSANRNVRPTQKDYRVQTMSHLWPPPPPPPNESRPPSRPSSSFSAPSLKPNSRFPASQRPGPSSSKFTTRQKPPSHLDSSPSTSFIKSQRPPGLLEVPSKFPSSESSSFLDSASSSSFHSRPGHREVPSKFPNNQRPSEIFETSPSQFPSFGDDIRTIQNNFGQISQTFTGQKNRFENIKPTYEFNPQLTDTSSRRPQTFLDSSDPFISETNHSPHGTNYQKQEFQNPNRGFQSENKHRIPSTIIENSPVRQNHFVQNAIPNRNNWRDSHNHQNPEDTHSHQSLPQSFSTFNIKDTSFSSRPQTFTDLELKDSNRPINETSYSIEPIVQFSQSIEASEHHSTYHPSPSIYEQQPSPIRLTKGPDFGSATRSYPEIQQRTTSAPDVKKRITLKDIISEDCPNAKEVGYCASPPRYPANQISKIMNRCADLLNSLYAPVPEEEEDEDTGESVTNSINSTRNIERGNRQVWSWARPGDSQRTVCDSERRRIEPGYVQELTSGRWFVVLQAPSMQQHIALDNSFYHIPVVNYIASRIIYVIQFVYYNVK